MLYAHAGEDTPTKGVHVTSASASVADALENNSLITVIGHLTEAKDDAADRRCVGLLHLPAAPAECGRAFSCAPIALQSRTYPILALVVPDTLMVEARALCRSASSKGLMREAFSCEVAARSWARHWYELLSLDRTIRTSRNR